MSYRATGDVVTDWALEQARNGCSAKGGDFNPDTLACVCSWGTAPDGRCLTVGEWAMAPEAAKKAQCDASGGVYINGQCSGATTGGGGGGGGSGGGGGPSSSPSGAGTKAPAPTHDEAIVDHVLGAGAYTIDYQRVAVIGAAFVVGLVVLDVLFG